jgi:4a-hydroxytetrahydrobiopterin dehydratase
MSDLASEKCIPCRGGVPPLAGDDLRKLEAQLGSAWRVVEEHHLERELTFPDFATALAFVNRVGALAEEEGHHPDLLLAWGRVGITLYTHKAGGLTRSDFVLAAKIDRLS